MKLQLIKTKETDGDWYKILVDGKYKKAISISERGEEEAYRIANEALDFYKENKGEYQIIKEEEV